MVGIATVAHGGCAQDGSTWEFGHKQKGDEPGTQEMDAFPASVPAANPSWKNDWQMVPHPNEFVTMLSGHCYTDEHGKGNILSVQASASRRHGNQRRQGRDPGYGRGPANLSRDRRSLELVLDALSVLLPPSEARGRGTLMASSEGWVSGPSWRRRALQVGCGVFAVLLIMAAFFPMLVREWFGPKPGLEMIASGTLTGLANVSGDSADRRREAPPNLGRSAPCGAVRILRRRTFADRRRHRPHATDMPAAA